MKRIIYLDDDKKIIIVIPSPEYLQTNTIESLINRTVPSGKEYRIINTSEIPIDRTFRDAWENINSIEVNMEKAKEIHKEKLRQLRKPELEKLDIEYMKAIESKNVELQEEIINKKIELRNITEHPNLLNAETPEKLKDFNPFEVGDQNFVV